MPRSIRYETPVLKAFREYIIVRDRVYAEVDALDGNTSEEELEARFRPFRKAEAAVLNTLVESALDLALKFKIYADDGVPDMALSSHNPIWLEMKAMIADVPGVGNGTKWATT